MKSFLAAWLAEAPRVLAREFGGERASTGEIELRPSSHLPQPETATTLAIALGDGYSGRFLVTADRYALHAIFAAAKVTDGTLDADRDRGLWSGVLEQIADVAAQSLGGAVPISIEDADWRLGLPSAAYELSFGESVLLVAFTDDIQAKEAAIPEPAPEKQAESIPASASSRPVDSDSPAAAKKIAPGGIDLLLDVELEASLRFGSREMPLNEVLDLGAGDVVELDRHVSDPVDLLVGDKIVARGEVVLVNGSFGLRVLEVAEPKKCLESIRCLF
jgi:flagellar motor switch protein FliN/FliY